MPSTVAEIDAMSWTDMKLVFAISHAEAIHDIFMHGEAAITAEVERWEPETRATVAGALAEVT